MLAAKLIGLCRKKINKNKPMILAYVIFIERAIFIPEGKAKKGLFLLSIRSCLLSIQLLMLT
jgi:hypothetical protein